jgi:hypothetical protein
VSEGKLRIHIGSSRGSPAGAEAAYILRRLAARAGSYAPGIQESLFNEIARRHNGSTLDKVHAWLEGNSGKLAYFGYQVISKRANYAADELVGWVADGMGFRAAVLGVDARKLYKDASLPSGHAVALVRHDETSGIGDEQLDHGVVMVDAMVGRDRVSAVPATLERAHFAQKRQTILMYWTGYS